jgi:phosphatidylglycerophosphate synthase
MGSESALSVVWSSLHVPAVTQPDMALAFGLAFLGSALLLWRGRSATLSSAELRHLAQYKYVSGGYTWLDYKLTPFWNWLVELLPTWMAPNMVTFIGFVTVNAASLLLWWHTPLLAGLGGGGADHAGEEARWVFGVHAVALFIYQHLDAVDGKQARRTGSSSPLGQLFDHGCDCFVNFLCVMNCSACLHFGAGPRMAIFALSLCLPFFVQQWAEYHTGLCQTSNGYVGVTEGITLLVAIEAWTGVAGTAWWCAPQPALLGLAARDALLVFCAGSNSVMIAQSAWSVLAPGAAEAAAAAEMADASMRGDKALSRGAALAQLAPLAVWGALAAVWLFDFDASAGHGSDGGGRRDGGVADGGGPLQPFLSMFAPSEAFATAPVLCSLLAGAQYALVTTRMIVAHMCKSPYAAAPNVACLAPLFIVAAAHTFGGLPFVAETTLAWLATVAALGMYLFYVVTAVREICAEMGIMCFSLAYMKQKKAL